MKCTTRKTTKSSTLKTILAVELKSRPSQIQIEREAKDKSKLLRRCST